MWHLRALNSLCLLFGLVLGRPLRRQLPRRLAFRRFSFRGGAGVVDGNTHPTLIHATEDSQLILKSDAVKAYIEGEQSSSQIHGDFADALTNESVKTETKAIPAWKASLPVPLCNKGPQALQKLCIAGNIDIYLLGTAHVSNDSSADVQLLLSHIDPDCIFVELCDARMSLLENHNDVKGDSTEQEESATKKEKVSWRERWRRRGTEHRNDNHTTTGSPGNWFQTMSASLLTRVQEDYAEKLGVELGGEFKCAHSYWRRKQEARRVDPFPKGKDRRTHLILGDRPVQLTLMRAWESLPFWAKVKVCVGLLWSSLPFGKPSVEELRAWLASVMQTDGADILTQSLEELRRYFPTLYITIIAERDAWLAAKLMQTCRALRNNPDRPRRQTIVAIVGAGHVPGIVRWLTTRTTLTPEQLLSTLVTTQRWAKDETVQQLMIPNWIHEVVAVHDFV